MTNQPNGLYRSTYDVLSALKRGNVTVKDSNLIQKYRFELGLATSLDVLSTSDLAQSCIDRNCGCMVQGKLF